MLSVDGCNELGATALESTSVASAVAVGALCTVAVFTITAGCNELVATALESTSVASAVGVIAAW